MHQNFYVSRCLVIFFVAQAVTISHLSHAGERDVKSVDVLKPWKLKNSTNAAKNELMAKDIEHNTNLPLVVCQLIATYSIDNWHCKSSVDSRYRCHKSLVAVSHNNKRYLLRVSTPKETYLFPIDDASEVLDASVTSITRIRYLPNPHAIMGFQFYYLFEFHDWFRSGAGVSIDVPKSLCIFNSEATSIAVSPDEKLFAASFRNGIVGLWKMETEHREQCEQCLHTFKDQNGKNLEWSCDGAALFTTTQDDSDDYRNGDIITVWDIRNTWDVYAQKKRLSLTCTKRLAKILPSPRNSQHLVIMYKNNELFLWDLATTKKIAKFELPVGVGTNRILKYSPQGNFLAAIYTTKESDNRSDEVKAMLCIWDALTGKLCARSVADASYENALFLSEDELLCTVKGVKFNIYKNEW